MSAPASRHLWGKFSGRRADGKSLRVSLPGVARSALPRDATLLGRAVRIVYEVAKADDHGRASHYDHEFTRPAVLAVDPTGHVLYIIGDFSVTHRGITDRGQ